MRPHPPANRKLRVVQLAAVIFLTVSGGPYGLEPLLLYAGENAAFLLLLVTPLLWDIPAIFTVLELNSMMPVTGGYYQWVKRAMGLRWAFYEGWWTWLYTFADLAIYPVLFITYAAFFFPGIEVYKIPVCLVIIWTSAALNILGIVPVGRVSMVLGAMVLLPFVVLFVIAISTYHDSYSLPALSLGKGSFSTIGMGLFTIMWNFIGWDNTTTYAEEVNRPARSYIRAVLIAFLTVFTIYFIAVATAHASGIDPAYLDENGWPVLGTLLAGNWLAIMIAAGGMASALGLYSAVLLSVSRIPQVMSEDRLLHPALERLHPKYRSPYVSIVVCSVVVSVMVLWTFGDLIIIDVTLYGAALLLEFVALIILRKKAAGEPRPFRIPLNRAGLVIMALIPFSVYIIAVTAALMDEGNMLVPVIFAVCALLSAELVWQFIRFRRRG